MKSVMVAASAAMGAGLFVGWRQQQTNARLRQERAAFGDHSAEIARLRAENPQLAQAAAEAEGYRDDAAELERLKEEAGALAERARTAKRQQELAAQAAAAEAATKVYDVAEVDRPPAPSGGARPVYPFDLRRAGVGGQAIVSFVVSANGEIEGVEGVSATHPEFQAAAIEAVKKMKFTAGQKAGLPVAVRVQIPIVFSLGTEKK